jgi:hypothetical protein
MTDKNIAACVPCKDLEQPIGCSRVEHCAECAEPVWVSPSTDAVINVEEYTILCTPCALGRMVRTTSDGGRVMGMDSRQAQELLDHGLSHDEIRRLVRFISGTYPAADDE